MAHSSISLMGPVRQNVEWINNSRSNVLASRSIVLQLNRLPLRFPPAKMGHPWVETLKRYIFYPSSEGGISQTEVQRSPLPPSSSATVHFSPDQDVAFITCPNPVTNTPPDTELLSGTSPKDIIR